MKTNYIKYIIAIIFLAGTIASSKAQSGQNAYFDAGPDSYIDLGIGSNLACLDTLSTKDKLTITMWIKWENLENPNVGNWANLFTLADSSSGSGENGVFWVQHNSNNTSFEFVIHSSSRSRVSSDTKPENGIWYHLACTYDGSLLNKNMKFYVNGVLENTISQKGDLRDIPPASKLIMGRWASPDNSYRRFNGHLDEVSIWSIALNQSEIIDMMTDPELVTDTNYSAAGLLGYWNFDNLTADDLTACNNNGNNGSYQNVILPIELLYFDAELVNKEIMIRWSTASETNNDYFTVQRSIHGTDWSDVGTEKGAGNSSMILNYVLVDESPNNGINYYRLKQTDYDGKYSYSDIVAITFKNNPGIALFPNPASEFIFLRGIDKEDYMVKLYTTLGEVVFAERNTSVIDIKSMEKGMYLLVITAPDGGDYNSMIVLKH